MKEEEATALQKMGELRQTLDKMIDLMMTVQEAILRGVYRSDLDLLTGHIRQLFDNSVGESDFLQHAIYGCTWLKIKSERQ